MGSLGGLLVGRVVWLLLLGAGARLQGAGACLVGGWGKGLHWVVRLVAEDEG